MVGFLQPFPYFAENGRLGREAACLQLGVDRVLIHGDLKDPAHRWNQRHLFQAVLELIQQLARQTGGPGEVTSRGAVADADFGGHGLSPFDHS